MLTSDKGLVTAITILLKTIKNRTENKEIFGFLCKIL